MPYEARKLPDEEAWVVVNEDGDVKAKHTSEEKAKRQVKLLGELERRLGE